MLIVLFLFIYFQILKVVVYSSLHDLMQVIIFEVNYS